MQEALRRCTLVMKRLFCQQGRQTLLGSNLPKVPTFGGEHFRGDFQLLQRFHPNIFQFNDELLSLPIVKLD